MVMLGGREGREKKEEGEKRERYEKRGLNKDQIKREKKALQSSLSRTPG